MDLARDAVAELAWLRHQTLQGLVQREIERMILMGELRAGERINENEIARRLDVSRAPVREALRGLEEADLVRFAKGRGVTVREISPGEAADIYEIRAALEALICRRVAATISKPQLDELGAWVGRMDEQSAAGDVEGYHESNVRFHERLVELSGSTEFTGFYRTVTNKLILFRRRTLGHGGAVAVSNHEHHAIVAHLAARDPDAAAMAMHAHITASGQRMQRSLEEFVQGASAPEETRR